MNTIKGSARAGPCPPRATPTTFNLIHRSQAVPTSYSVRKSTPLLDSTVGKQNHARRQLVTLAQRRNDPAETAQRRKDDATILGSAFTLTALVLLALRFGGRALQEFDSLDVAGLTSGDFLGAVFWSVALYFASPWQLLLLFLGKIETERPSDWVLRRMGIASKLDVDAIDYEAPLPLRIATIAFFAVSGVAMSAALDAGLGDGTWAVSSGIGALFAAGLYEVGRPDRLSVDEAKSLEAQWQDFRGFAEDALVPRGRCHESEVFKAFRARFGKYRTQEAISDARLRDMVRNWNRKVETSRTGWMKNVSLRITQEALERREEAKREAALAEITKERESSSDEAESLL